MSATVDEKIVSMKFDNRQFENNVKTSLGTLDRLKQSLNLSGAAKGLENINSVASRFSLSPLCDSVDTVRTKFSYLQATIQHQLNNIVDSAVNAGKRIVSALTTDPIKDGFAEYETQMNSVQTILANTSKEGTTVKDVNAALDELNTYADKTIYNFTEMTRNIGTFTAAGVKLDDSVNAIQGIANLAAVSGSNSQQASTAMYQLSQALAAGKVNLQDWNSVVNAGMGGKVFQDALIRTSEHLKTGAKAAIKAKGSFRESISEGWMTQEVLTETLSQFSTAADTQKEYEAAVKKFVSQGYSKQEAKEMADMARTAGNAATKVKTFTQLIDTLKEALGSGWTKTWQLIIGDFEEAKSLWTDVSDFFSDVINKSSDARNNMLEVWAKKGGRKMAIESIKNAFKGLLSIIKPIKEAFREVFPRTTAKQLLHITRSIRDLTKTFKLSDEQSKNLKSTFKGLFSIVGIGIDAIKAIGKGIASLIGSFSGIGGGVLEVTAALGENITDFREYIKQTDLFGKAVKMVTGFLSNIITKIKEFGKASKNSFDSFKDNGFIDFFKALWNIVKQVGSAIVNVLGGIGKTVSDVIGNGDIFEVINTGLIAGILLGLQKFTGSLKDVADNVGGILENVKGVLDDVRGCLQAYQEQLKAGALLKIASAIALLAAAIFVISTIDPDSLGKALGAITVLFAELVGSLALFSKIDSNYKGAIKAAGLMNGLAVAILILSAAMKVMSSISWEGIAKGLVSIGALMTELALFLNFAKFDKKFGKTAKGILVLSAALVVLSYAVKNFGAMSWEEIGKGLASIGALLVELTVFTRLTGNAKHVLSTATSMILLGAALKIMASAVKDFGSMSWDEIGRGLATMAGALAEVVIAMNTMPKSTLLIGTGLVVVGAALKVLASAMKDFSSMSWEEIGKGLVVIGGALVELAIGLHFMNNTLAGSAALLIAAAALSVIAPVLKTLGEMSVSSIVKSLLTLAGAFAVIGVAGLLLTPIIPSILGLAAAFALFGVATLGIGAGITLIATGISALSVALTAGATSIVAGLTVIITGILDLIPTIATEIGEGLVALAMVIGTYAPQFAESLLKFVYEILNSLATYMPKIVDALAVLLIGVINGLAKHIPTLIVAVVNLIGKVLEGVIKALNGIDTTNLLKTIVAVGLMTALMYALSGIVGLIPSAMAGLLGVGVVIAEMALVLGAIGALAQIPGLSWLIEEGGNLLGKIGTAIGQFIGGIVGGVAKGMTASLPDIGTNLSKFMVNVTPFINGAKTITPEMLSGVKTLTGVILALTAANILDSIATFVTGENSLEKFSEQIIPFGKAMVKFSSIVSGKIDGGAVTAAANAGRVIAQMADTIPNTGGLAAKFAGDNDLGEFSKKLIPFGKAMASFSKEVSGKINADAITASANAGKIIAEMTDTIPNDGGAISWFTGDNDLKDFTEKIVPFGKAMTSFSKEVSGKIDEGAVTAAANAGKVLAKMSATLPNSGGLSGLFTGEVDFDDFTDNIKSFGRAMAKFSKKVSGIDEGAVTAAAKAGKMLVKMATSFPKDVTLSDAFGDVKDSFPKSLENFGTGIAAFSNAVSGSKMNIENVKSAGSVLDAISSMTKKKNNNLFSSDLNVTALSSNLSAIGDGISGFCEKVSGKNINAEKAETAANILKTISSTCSNTFKLNSFLSGDVDYSTLKTKLKQIGSGIAKFSEEVSGKKFDVKAAQNACGILKSITANISGDKIKQLVDDNVDFGTFGTKFAQIGKAIAKFSETVSGKKMDFASANSAVKLFKSIMANLPNTDKMSEFVTNETSFKDFGTKLRQMGNAVVKFSESVSGKKIDFNTTNSAIKLFKSIMANLPNTEKMGAFVNGETSFKDFGTRLKQMGNAVVKFSESVSGKKIDFKACQSAIKLFKSIMANLPNTDKLNSFASGDTNFKDFGTKLKQMGNAVVKFSNSVSGKVKLGDVNSAIKACNSLVKMARGMSGVDFGSLKSFSSALKKLGTAQVDKFVSAFKNSGSKLNNAGTSMAKNLAKGIKSGMPTITNAGKNAGSSAIKGLKSKQANFSKAGESLVKAFGTGITKGSTSASKKVGSMATEASKGAKDKYGKFESAGKYLGKGLLKGLEAKRQDLYDKGASLAKAANKGFKDNEDINSPSRVWYGFGGYMIEGLVNALGDGEKDVNKSTKSVAKRSTKTFSAALSKMSDMFSMDVDTEPTIRPVLDLSNVEAGAGTIGNMLGLSPSIDATLTKAQSISSMMQNRQNGNHELLSAIKGLRKDMSSNTGTSVNVQLDYNAGSDANEIANDIAVNLRRAIRRGV
jgi:tape measure domain-containing protein